MRWKIHQFVFCEKNQTLRDGDATLILEPLAVEVLAYFCRHPNVMISRDLLIAEVWNGRTVTDNAVTRVITKLRKALADSPDSPRFIATFPKKGYKFVADLEPFDEHIDEQDTGSPTLAAANTSHSRSHTAPLIAGLVVLSLVIGVLCAFWFSSHTVSTSGSYRIDALTHGAERELHPAVSPDGRYLAFSTFSNADGIRLHLKDLETDETIEIGSQDGWSGPASWSDDGKQIAYLNTTNDTCQYYILSVAKLVITNRQLIHNCPKGSYGKIMFSHENHKLVYAETAGVNLPFSIFELNVKTGDVRRLAQPELVLGGNSQFDLHPTENKLLISSPNRQQWLEIYSLDLASDELRHLFELREYTCCAIWDHSGERVVIQGEHPAQDLLSFDLNGKNRTVLFQVPHSVSSPKRIPHNKSYAYVGGTLNRNIYSYAFDSKASTLMINSAMDDWLPRASPDQNTLAFISVRSGNEEIWLRQQGQTFERKLTSYKDGRHYFDMQWSPDAKQIAGMTINEIHLTDATSGAWRKIKMPQEEITGISWKDKQTLAFSIKTNGQWQHKYYDTLTNQLTSAAGEWQFVRHALDANDSLWIDAGDAIFYGDQYIPLELKLPSLFQYKRSRLIKRGDFVYYTSTEGGASQLIKFNVKTRTSVPLVKIDAGDDFSISDSSIYYSQLKNNDADIYRASEK